jgi:TRAP-type mannitol/chloroaromatic compound transport system permease small subunit
MAFPKALIKIIDTVIDRAGKVFCFFALAILAVITFEVFSRRVFGQPTIWAYELIIMLFAMYVVLICAYGFQKGSFVFVDVLSRKFPPVIAHIVSLVTFVIFFFPFVLGILPSAFDFFWMSFKTREVSMSAWAPIIWPAKFALFLGLVMLLAQGVSEVLKQVLWFFEREKNQKDAA